MPVELRLLVWSAVLAFALVLIASFGNMIENGPVRIAGNREGLSEPTGWRGRAKRAHLNLLENLILFAILVLVARAAGRLNATTELGAQLFFWARVAHAAVYIAGIPWLRTLVWGVSVVGMALIFSQVT